MIRSIDPDSVSRKKSRVVIVDDNGDRISNLPDTLISHILSLLPTKDAVRTCTLSKDWEFKWTSIYCIDVDDRIRFSRGKIKKNTSFVDFMYRTLLLSQNSTLKRFSFCCSRKYNLPYITTWISNVLMRNIQCIRIAYPKEETVVLPRSILDSSTLTDLSLCLCGTLCLPIKNSVPNLKTLCLNRVEIVNDRSPSSGQLMFSFPFLETLELRFCKWRNVESVEVNAPLLTIFRFSGARVNHTGIKVSGGDLAKFKYYGPLEDVVLDASAVVHADVLEFVPRQFLQVDGNDVALAQRLLNGLSSLEYLKLHMIPLGYDVEDYNYDGVESVPSCISSQLKEVKIDNFSGSIPQVHLAKFLLGNGVKTSKVTVSVGFTKLMSNTCIGELLSEFPKGSTCVTVVIA